MVTAMVTTVSGALDSTLPPSFCTFSCHNIRLQWLDFDSERIQPLWTHSPLAVCFLLKTKDVVRVIREARTFFSWCSPGVLSDIPCLMSVAFGLLPSFVSTFRYVCVVTV